MSLKIIKVNNSNSVSNNVDNKETIIEQLNDTDSITITNLTNGNTYNIIIEFQFRGWMINSIIKSIEI
jgi:hypothetical protein